MKVLLAGEGGQGVQVAGEILALAAFKEGKKVSLIPNFGVEQRGGVSICFLEIEENGYPKFKTADIAAIFCDRAIERVKSYIGKSTELIFGPAVNIEKIPGLKKPLLLKTEKLPARVWNILILKKIVDITQIVKIETLKDALEEELREKFIKDRNLYNLNLEVLR